jgi:mono/diheme cytochrome c family protein
VNIGFRCLVLALLLPTWIWAQPVVPAFDRFHAEAVSAEGGRLLMQELNCAACHDLPAAIPRPAPNLEQVGDRLAIPMLTRFIAAPHSVKPGTLMPNLGVTPADTEAIAHYLAARRSGKSAESATGDATAGKALFHEIGCVACHSPEGKQLTGSVPLELGRRYRKGALADYLLAPAGRMPNMKLSAKEARDLEAYLNPRPAADVAPRPKLVAAGKAAYSRHGCARCHEPAAAKPVPIASGQGCLAPSGEAPDFALSARQAESLRLALAEGPRKSSARETVDFGMRSLNCYACHSRQGKGGVAEERRDYFHATDPDKHAVGDLGVFPPGLEAVGRKLTTDWLQRIVTGDGGEVRPYLKTRMPRFGPAAVEGILAALPEADRRAKPIQMDTSGLQRHHRGHYGRTLLGTGKGGLACVTCHGLQGKRAVGSGVIDLTQTAQRLQPGYFKELLLDPARLQPGTIMPPLFQGRSKAAQEIEQIWTYLKEAEQQKLPDGLLREDTYELFPAKAGKPIVFRTFIHGVGTHAVAVGYPEGVHAAFDAYASRWALLWRGRFLDAATTWTDRFSEPDKPLGTGLKTLPKTGGFTGKLRFGGFRLDDKGRPVFLYAAGAWQIEDQLIPEGESFRRRLTIKGPDGEVDVRALAGGVRTVTVTDGLGLAEEVLTW